MDTLSRTDLAHALCNAHETLTLADARSMVNLLFRDILPTALKRGRTIKLQGFGEFCAPVRSARRFRNPRTQEVIATASKRSIRFKPSRTLRAYVAGERT